MNCIFVDSKKKDSNVGPYELSADSKKKDSNTGNPLWLSNDAEYWPEPNVKFIQIAAIHSELIALSAGGQLYQWKWEDSDPYKTLDVGKIYNLFNIFIHIICFFRTMYIIQRPMLLV